jgi:hypothetical protein
MAGFVVDCGAVLRQSFALADAIGPHEAVHGARSARCRSRPASLRRAMPIGFSTAPYFGAGPGNSRISWDGFD